MDLVALLHQALEQNRDQLNASRIAQGEPGRVEIQINPAMKRVVVNVMVPEQRRVA